MFGFLKRLFGLGLSGHHQPEIDDIVQEHWDADFSSIEEKPGDPSGVRFSITSEKLYRAYLCNNALCLGVKKTGTLAWTENMIYRYQDLDMKGRISLDPKGAYAAAGLIFRMVDDLTYYLVLVSSRGYFRLDLVRNSVPLALAGWTEALGMADSKGAAVEFDLEIICYGSKILLLINKNWAGAWDDPSIPEGRIAFAAASYEDTASDSNPPQIQASGQGEFSACAELVEFSLDSHIENVEKRFEDEEQSAAPESRVKLAETFTAMGRAGSALAQLHKAWESREKMAKELETAEDGVVLAAIQSENIVKTAKELLLGAKLALALELWDEAEEYIEAAQNAVGVEKEARGLKAVLLYSRSRYDDVIHFAEELSTGEKIKEEKPKRGKPKEKKETDLDFRKLDNLFDDPPSFFNLLGHCYYHTENYLKAAEAYDHSFELDNNNGFNAKNAAAAWELADKAGEKEQRKKALDRYLKAGRAFLALNLYQELGLLIPKFRLLGIDDWEARALTGKWAFGIEDWKTAREELEIAEQLRKKNKGEPDPALYFLQALLLIREGKRREASGLFEKAVKYAPDFLLFRFRLAENRFLLNKNPSDPQLISDLETILKVNRDDESYGWIHNFAAHVALSKGDLDSAQEHLDKAAAVLGEVPAVRVNRAVFLSLRGMEADALRILESKTEEDPEGLMANCAGNILVRSRRFEEADLWYRRALAASPFNVQYRYNRGACLVELGRYGEADDVLTAGPRTNQFSPEASPEILELIAFIAVKKGEHKRAEEATRAALNINPNHVPSLLQLGWNRAFAFQWDEVEEILDRLDSLELNNDTAKGRDDLEKWMIDALYKTISCGSCGREWKVERNPKSTSSLKIYAMPPDEMPAGTCSACGKTYCVGCRKDALDDSGRFVCPDCGKTLKLSDDGLKALLNDWARKNLKKE